MEELILRPIYLSDELNQHVKDGHYDLFGPDGEMISPQLWEERVQPDWTVRMRMWPSEDRGTSS